MYSYNIVTRYFREDVRLKMKEKAFVLLIRPLLIIFDETGYLMVSSPILPEICFLLFVYILSYHCSWQRVITIHIDLSSTALIQSEFLKTRISHLQIQPIIMFFLKYKLSVLIPRAFLYAWKEIRSPSKQWENGEFNIALNKTLTWKLFWKGFSTRKDLLTWNFFVLKFFF